MSTGPDAPPEHVILDENVKAQWHTFYKIGDMRVRAAIGRPLVGLTYGLEWAGDEALQYITMDEIPRPDKVLDSLVVSRPLWTGPLHSETYLTEMINLAEQWGWIGINSGDVITQGSGDINWRLSEQEDKKNMKKSCHF